VANGPVVSPPGSPSVAGATVVELADGVVEFVSAAPEFVATGLAGVQPKRLIDSTPKIVKQRM
jgi:hypothetical protein